MLKRITILFILCLNLLFGYEKPTLLILWSDTCSHCESFIKNTLPSPMVQDAMKNYNLININVNIDKNVPFDIDYTGVVPSFHIVNNQRSQLANTITGDIPPKEFANFLNKFTQMYKMYQNSLQMNSYKQ